MREERDGTQENRHAESKAYSITSPRASRQARIVSFLKKFNEKFAEFNGDITQKPIYSGFSLSMIRPNDKGKPTKKQPNSVMIKHIVHWLLIMGGEKN